MEFTDQYWSPMTNFNKSNYNDIKGLNNAETFTKILSGTLVNNEWTITQNKFWTVVLGALMRALRIGVHQIILVNPFLWNKSSCRTIHTLTPCYTGIS